MNGRRFITCTRTRSNAVILNVCVRGPPIHKKDNTPKTCAKRNKVLRKHGTVYRRFGSSSNVHVRSKGAVQYPRISHSESAWATKTNGIWQGGHVNVQRRLGRHSTSCDERQECIRRKITTLLKTLNVDCSPIICIAGFERGGTIEDQS